MTPNTLAAARTERDRLMRNYRIAKDKQFDELCADPECGDRLRRFVRTLGHFGINESDRFLNYFNNECRKWLLAARIKIREEALHAIGDRSMKIREKAGLLAISDPLPGDPDNVFFMCKKALEL